MSNKIQSIKNIELSSLCNMSCSYCVSSRIKEYRKPGLMSFHTFKKITEQIEKFYNKGTQREIWLHGTGESFLNEELPGMVEYLKSKVPLPVGIATNGLRINEGIVRVLKTVGINRIDVSCHDEKVAQDAYAIISKQGIYSVINYGSQTGRFNWAGQLDFENTHKKVHTCPWIGNQECFILHDGSITSCCFDAYGTKILGHIDDDIGEIEIKAFELCTSCNHIV